MKKQLMRFVSATPYGKFFKAAALVLILSGSSCMVNAQVKQVSAKIEANKPGTLDAQINHLGVSNGMLVFEVKVNNVTGENFHITVKDIDGTVLFRNAYDDKNFVKTFMIPRPESDKLVFTIRNSSSDKTESFEINSHTRVVEDVVVKRI